MPRFLSVEWVAAFNAALEGSPTTAIEAGQSLVAADGSFRVEQVVHDVPPDAGTVRTTLVVEPGSVVLLSGDSGDDANVVVSLSYEDAAAMSRGELEPTQALGTGRLRIRGDLSVLMASQALLAEAASKLAELQAETTY